jgi:hypothetical protein
LTFRRPSDGLGTRPSEPSFSAQKGPRRPLHRVGPEPTVLHHAQRHAQLICRPDRAPKVAANGVVSRKRRAGTHQQGCAYRRWPSASLLALRRYLRIQNVELRELATIWSLSAQQMRESTASGDGRRLVNEAARVQQAFARANPGHTLAISPPRDLERQVTLWTGNLSIRTVADRLLREAIQLVSQPEYVLPPTARAFGPIHRLAAGRVSPEPGNAAPGTSAHGQMRAVDFVVMQGGRVVTGTQQATIPIAWTASGWAQRLADATAATQLIGPLAHPYEPWHWSLP